MEYFQLQLLHKNKLIQIKGEINALQVPFSKFLKEKASNPTFFPRLTHLANLLSYTNEQLFVDLLFAAIIIGGQIYNLITLSLDFTYELGCIFCILYALIFCILINNNRQIYLQLIFLLIFVVLMIIAYNKNIFIGLYPAILIVISLIIVLVARALKILQRFAYTADLFTQFSFQSNILVGVYVLWKGSQIILSKITSYTYNYSQLYVVMITLAILNSFKAFTLFDYDILHIFKIFQEMNQKKFQTPNNKNEDQKKLTQGDEEQTQSVDSNTEDKESKVRYIGAGCLLIIQIGIIIQLFVYSSTLTVNQLHYFFELYFYSIVKITFLLMVAQYERVLINQQKLLFSYIIRFFFDGLLIILASIPIVFSLESQLSQQNILITAILPFLTIKVFHELHIISQTSSNNAYYIGFFLGILFPFAAKEIVLFYNFTQLQYVIDGIILAYSFFIIVVWSKIGDYKQLLEEIYFFRTIKNYKWQILQKLKSVQLQYNQIVQSNIYTHAIILLTVYQFDTIQVSSNTSFKSMYLTIYYCSLFLYFCCLKNSFTHDKEILEKYEFGFWKLIPIGGSLVYMIVALTALSSSSFCHVQVSLIMFVLFSLFTAVTQLQNLISLQMKNYRNFMRVMAITVFFILIFHPMITLFVSFYFYSIIDTRFLFNFSVCDYSHMWIVLTIIGIIIHSVLNLTEKSKKDLFIVQYMSSEMRNFNILQDSEKILMISNMYEIFNQKSTDLLSYLRSQKHIVAIVHDDIEIDYDYSFVEAESDEATRHFSFTTKNIESTEVVDHFLQHIQVEKKEQSPAQVNPIVSFFTGKNRNKVQHSLDKSKQGCNLNELKRLVYRHKSANPKTTAQDLCRYEKTQEYRQFVENEEKGANLMNRLFLFLAEPGDSISQETFVIFLDLLLIKEDENSSMRSKVFNKFGEGNDIDQIKFKSFIVDFTAFKYELADQNIRQTVKTFVTQQIMPLLVNGQEKFRYFMKRKTINFNQNQRDIWLKDSKNQKQMQALSSFKERQLKKKARLLDRNEEINMEEIEQILLDRLQIFGGFQIKKKKTVKIAPNEKLNKKKKKFIKSETLYSMFVNSLIQCYICYEKEAQNFQITSIKCSLSNLLAIATKIIDFIFVYGYTSIYLLIAYAQSNYSSSTPFYNFISFKILLIIASTAVAIYIALLIYHKQDFEQGTLGVDNNQRTLSLRSLKLYTTSILFLLGSALANLVQSIAFNSFICDPVLLTLFNFPNQSCYTTIHYLYMITSSLILILYWPLSSITFPFSTAMDRSLQIKYKAQYEILYLQCKFLINAYNTLLNPLGFQQEQLSHCLLKVAVCSILAIAYHQMQPCSYQLINIIQSKIYLILVLINFAGVLCYFISFYLSLAITGGCLGLYLGYFAYNIIRSYKNANSNDEADEMLEEKIKKQENQKKFMRKKSIDGDGITDHKDKNISPQSNFESEHQSKLKTQSKSKKSNLEIVFKNNEDFQQDKVLESDVKIVTDQNMSYENKQLSKINKMNTKSNESQIVLIKKPSKKR